MQEPETREAMTAFSRAVWQRKAELGQMKQDFITASVEGGYLVVQQNAFIDGGTVIQVQPEDITPRLQMEIIRLQQQCDADDEKLRQIFNIIT